MGMTVKFSGYLHCDSCSSSNVFRQIMTFLVARIKTVANCFTGTYTDLLYFGPRDATFQSSQTMQLTCSHPLCGTCAPRSVALHYFLKVAETKPLLTKIWVICHIWKSILQSTKYSKIKKLGFSAYFYVDKCSSSITRSSEKIVVKFRALLQKATILFVTQYFQTFRCQW